MLFQRRSVFLFLGYLLILLSIAIEPIKARSCLRRNFKQVVSEDDDKELQADDEKLNLNGVKRTVELPADCGRYTVPLARQRLRGGVTRVLNGYDAKLGQFPSYVQLHLPWFGSGATGQRCGGSILTSRHIITAAHCIPANVELARGIVASGLAGGPDWSLVKDFWVTPIKACKSSGFRTKQQHWRWFSSPSDPYNVYDVAIVKLAQDIQFTETVQPVCLPQPGAPMTNNQQAYSIGLGFTYSNPMNNVQIEADRLKVLPAVRVDCPAVDQHESVICNKASDPNQMGLVCQGDSGGPVMGLNAQGQQTVYGLHSYVDMRCYIGQFSDEHYIFKSADVYNLRSEIDRLLEECA